MHSRSALVIAILGTAMQLYPVRAQAVPCVACRALEPFPHCDDAAMAQPPTGAVSVVGTVAPLSTGPCGTGVVVDVIRSSQALPRRIAFDVSCLLWNGEPGDMLRIMVDETPSPDGSYRLRACK